MLSLEEGTVKNTFHSRQRHLGRSSDPDGERARRGFITEPGGGEGRHKDRF